MIQMMIRYEDVMANQTFTIWWWWFLMIYINIYQYASLWKNKNSPRRWSQVVPSCPWRNPQFLWDFPAGVARWTFLENRCEFERLSGLAELELEQTPGWKMGSSTIKKGASDCWRPNFWPCWTSINSDFLRISPCHFSSKKNPTGTLGVDPPGGISTMNTLLIVNGRVGWPSI